MFNDQKSAEEAFAGLDDAGGHPGTRPKLQEAKDDLELRVQARTNELQSEVEERVRAQEALFEERKILRLLIDNVPDSMYMKDTECRFLVANLAVAR